MEKFVDTIVMTDDLPDSSEGYFHAMFSTPILHLKIKNWSEKKSELLNLYNSISVNKEIFKRQNLSHQFDVETDYHYIHDNQEDDTNCVYDQEIGAILQDELEDVADTFDMSLEIVTSWFEKASIGNCHSAHNHGPTGLSAVCFIEFDPNHHSPTVFVNPDLCSDQLNFVPPHINEGSLIVFPSNIIHFTEPNSSDKKRIILSFNMVTEREFRFDDHDDPNRSQYPGL